MRIAGKILLKSMQPKIFEQKSNFKIKQHFLFRTVEKKKTFLFLALYDVTNVIKDQENYAERDTSTSVSFSSNIYVSL
jgi:hypothetical protein